MVLFDMHKCQKINCACKWVCFFYILLKELLFFYLLLLLLQHSAWFRILLQMKNKMASVLQSLWRGLPSYNVINHFSPITITESRSHIFRCLFIKTRTRHRAMHCNTLLWLCASGAHPAWKLFCYGREIMNYIIYNPWRHPPLFFHRGIRCFHYGQPYSAISLFKILEMVKLKIQAQSGTKAVFKAVKQ